MLDRSSITFIQGGKNENAKRIRAVFQEDDGEGKALPLEPQHHRPVEPGQALPPPACRGTLKEGVPRGAGTACGELRQRQKR